MSGSFIKKLFRYEATPPPDSWERISRELDNSMHSSDSMIASKLENISMPPPPGTWREIESILDSERVPSAKVVPIVYKRIAVAVIAVVAVAITVIYLYNDGAVQDPEMAAIAKRNPDIKTQMLPVPSPASAIALKARSLPSKVNNSLPRYIDIAPQPVTDQQEPEIFPDISEAHLTDLKPIDQDQRVSVPSAPLRDASGNIILDEDLICKPNDPYITVTGPNGSQTRISSKFLGFLRYLNGDASPDKNNFDGILWKDKFQLWRDKLLNENSFIPAANNFFDIFEMKDIIEE